MGTFTKLARLPDTGDVISSFAKNPYVVPSKFVVNLVPLLIVTEVTLGFITGTDTSTNALGALDERGVYPNSFACDTTESRVVAVSKNISFVK